MKTVKALLICGSGANSSFLLSNINDVAALLSFNLDVKAFWEGDVKQEIRKCDVIITTFQKNYIVEEYNYSEKPVLVISPEDLASLNGTNIVKKIIELFKEEIKDGQ